MSKFVIYTPNHSDYLVDFNEKGIGWNPDLKEARFFRTFEQANHIAKQIVAQMSEHTEPYAIFIQEVKEKNEQWKVKGEVEVRPEPNRAAFFRQQPEMRGHNVHNRPLKPDIMPVRYVVYQPAKDDYLAAVEVNGNFEQTGWAPHPQDAIAYNTPEDAERKASELVLSFGYELMLCELHQSEDQYWVKSLKELFPIRGSLN